MTGSAQPAANRAVAAAGTVQPEVDFAAVAGLLDDAAALVRTRRERGEPPARDHRPRIREAISRAAHLVQAGTDTTAPAAPSGAVTRRARTGGRDDPGLVARDWAMVLAAMQINAALGRGRYRDGCDVSAAARTLAGFGLDVGTLGAVTTAADLLVQAASVARGIAAAVGVLVHRYGQVIAYPLGPVLPADLDTDDIIAVAATPYTPGGNLRLLGIQHTGAGSHRMLLDTVNGPLPWPEQPTGPDQRVTAWRPVPHRRHPWHSR